MAEYGLQVSGRPPFENLGMLVEVFKVPLSATPDNTWNTHNLPTLSAEQAKKNCYILTFVMSDIRFGRTIMQAGLGGDLLFTTALPIIDSTQTANIHNKLVGLPAIGIQYRTMKYDGVSNIFPIAYVLVWLVERKNYVI